MTASFLLCGNPNIFRILPTFPLRWSNANGHATYLLNVNESKDWNPIWWEKLAFPSRSFNSKIIRVFLLFFNYIEQYFFACKLSNIHVRRRQPRGKECRKVLTFAQHCYYCIILQIGSISKTYQTSGSCIII